jgi:hypothetical protein
MPSDASERPGIWLLCNLPILIANIPTMPWYRFCQVVTVGEASVRNLYILHIDLPYFSLFFSPAAEAGHRMV